jgi:orotate phosphoribosyltransferase
VRRVTVNARPAGALARRIYERSYLVGEFRLRSGRTTNEYFGKYLFESDPELLRDVGLAVVELLPAQVDAVAGLELGGVPLATVVSQRSGLPALFVRKQAKITVPAGSRRAVMWRGARLAVIEDVLTSGGRPRQGCGRRNRGRGPRVALALHDDSGARGGGPLSRVWAGHTTVVPRCRLRREGGARGSPPLMTERAVPR